MKAAQKKEIKKIYNNSKQGRSCNRIIWASLLLWFISLVVKAILDSFEIFGTIYVVNSLIYGVSFLFFTYYYGKRDGAIEILANKDLFH